MPTRVEIENWSLMLREYSKRKNLTLWEGLCDYCGEFNVEPEIAASQLTERIKLDIEEEAQELNLMREKGEKSGRLPI
jgi:hypothetical protein